MVAYCRSKDILYEKNLQKKCKSTPLFGALVMLIDFSVDNFRSYRVEKKFSLVAAEHDDHLPENVAEIDCADLRLLKSAAIYGANASGKSNLIQGMHKLASMLLSPVDRYMGTSEGEQHDPYRLDPAALDEPTKFVVSFLLNNVIHKYSVSSEKNRITHESLVVYPQGRPQVWFVRTGSDFVFSSTSLKGDKIRLQRVTADSIPFLAIAVAFDHPQLAPLPVGFQRI